MKDRRFIEQMCDAFKKESYPGDNNILHCSYDKAWGGTLEGPCRECSEVADYFKGKTQLGHSPHELGWVAFGLNKLTPEAFLYWLPAFMEASLIHGVEADAVIESLEFRFESLESREWQDSRIGRLNKQQLIIVKKFFKLMLKNNYTDEDIYRKAIRNLEYYEREYC